MNDLERLLKHVLIKTRWGSTVVYPFFWNLTYRMSWMNEWNYSQSPVKKLRLTLITSWFFFLEWNRRLFFFSQQAPLWYDKSRKAGWGHVGSISKDRVGLKRLSLSFVRIWFYFHRLQSLRCRLAVFGLNLNPVRLPSLILVFAGVCISSSVMLAECHPRQSRALETQQSIQLLSRL